MYRPSDQILREARYDEHLEKSGQNIIRKAEQQSYNLGSMDTAWDTYMILHRHDITTNTLKVRHKDATTGTPSD